MRGGPSGASSHRPPQALLSLQIQALTTSMGSGSASSPRTGLRASSPLSLPVWWSWLTRRSGTGETAGFYAPGLGTRLSPSSPGTLSGICREGAVTQEPLQTDAQVWTVVRPSCPSRWFSSHVGGRQCRRGRACPEALGTCRGSVGVQCWAVAVLGSAGSPSLCTGSFTVASGGCLTEPPETRAHCTATCQERWGSRAVATRLCPSDLPHRLAG